MDDLSRLSNVTYSLHHNPNCSSPYLIRLIGKDQGCLDFLPYVTFFGEEVTKDTLCFGKTLSEVVEEAIKTLEIKQDHWRHVSSM